MTKSNLTRKINPKGSGAGGFENWTIEDITWMRAILRDIRNDRSSDYRHQESIALRGSLGAGVNTSFVENNVHACPLREYCPGAKEPSEERDYCTKEPEVYMGCEYYK